MIYVYIYSSECLFSIYLAQFGFVFYIHTYVYNKQMRVKGMESRTCREWAQEPSINEIQNRGLANPEALMLK